MRFGPVDAELDLPALEERVLARWRENDVVKQVARSREGAEPWVFYEGPPTANGRPGLHHVWARAFKDLFPRFQTMRGHAVPRKGGWDCHGLPVELEVEKALGLATKADIEAFGIEAFNEKCRASVQRYVEDWSSLTTRSGVWIDTADAYWTLTNDYIESVWWLVRQMWDKGLIYEGHRVSPYCGRCGTALSSHEVAQGYRDVVDPSIYVRFPLTGRSSQGGHGGPAAPDDADLLVWTTTPWTLISNVAAAVGPSFTYVRVTPPEGGRDLVMVEAAAERLFPGAPVHQRWSGADLAGWRYQRPFDVLTVPDGPDSAWRVVAADYVSVDDGSGIVHIAPAFGEEDQQVGRAEGLPTLNPVDADATFDHRVPRWQGRFVKDADREIIADLDERGLLVAEQAYEHSYPHCWRCGTPLIYWAKTSWFARTSERRAELLAENETIGWHPEHIKNGRFGRWLEGNVDWALSRDRYWGTPLPIWRCSGCSSETCIGSVAELSQLAGRDLSDLDLHRPYVDDVTWACTADGCTGTLRRLEPVLDAWFDSGSMPSAQHHHPFAADGVFEASYPADFICEAIDQTRGWFYSLLAVNTLVFDSTPYRNVVCLGHIVDEMGQKMSKSRGNVIDPWTIFSGFGADALRWYFFSSGQPWSPRRVFEEGIRESTRQTLLTLWNVFGFFSTYADLDGWQPPAPDDQPMAPTHVLDRWILSELDDTVRGVTEALDGFDALGGASRLARFVDDLSNWYVRRSRPRFWKASDPAAHATLHRSLVTTAQLLAPFCPFIADELYASLTGETSVHLSDWPAPTGAWDVSLAESMAAARRLVALGRAARTDAKVRVRQPLSRALLLHPGVTLGDEVLAEIATELNVKALEDVDTLSGLMTWTAVPNFRTLGPRLGPKVNEVKAALAAADGSELHRLLDAQGFVEVAGERLTADDVTLRAESHDAFALAEDAGWAVALDLELDDALRAEGTARELVRALNDLRKEVGLDIADRIDVTVSAADDVWTIVERHRDYVLAEVLALSLARADHGDHKLDLDGAPLQVTLAKA
ncbi:MAG TPA: isoleucine--tRNA ligase [Acidimicrobiales bacterium]|nr:isoleucine--tRNA ligase [Acidimicrobiales bacterium]